jgi:hypothetical protein
MAAEGSNQNATPLGSENEDTFNGLNNGVSLVTSNLTASELQRRFVVHEYHVLDENGHRINTLLLLKHPDESPERLVSALASV